jgi:hypothetical protein
VASEPSRLADLFWTELGEAVELLETSPEVGNRETAGDRAGG